MRPGDSLFLVWACEGAGGREFSGLIVAADLDEVLDAIQWAVVFHVRQVTPSEDGSLTVAMT